jgi:NAD(P)-dependent dehydrogenase (short-subunit alcohol dehydrogenase family)
MTSAWHDIRVNGVLPGLIENTGVDTEESQGSMPLGRRGTLAEVAKSISRPVRRTMQAIQGGNILVGGTPNRAM